MKNSGILKIVRRGDVYIGTNDGCKLVLKYVRHEPNFWLNLISMGNLDEECYNNFDGEK